MCGGPAILGQIGLYGDSGRTSVAEGTRNLHTVSSEPTFFGTWVTRPAALWGAQRLASAAADGRQALPHSPFQLLAALSTSSTMAELHIVGSIDKRPRLRRGRRPLRPLPEMDARERPNFRVVRAVHGSDALRPPRRRGGGGVVAPARRALHAQGDRRLAAHLAGRGASTASAATSSPATACAWCRRRPGCTASSARRGGRRARCASSSRVRAPRGIAPPPRIARAAAAAARSAARFAPRRRSHIHNPSLRAAFFLGGVPCSSTRSSSPRPSTASGCRPSPPASSRSTSASSSRTSRSTGVSVS